MEFIKEIRFDEKGLIPVVVQEASTNNVLMLAYMNEESLNLTLKTGKATYFSRSRQKLWVKGETSGNFQEVVDLFVDCDGDSILLKVNQNGNACHTNNHSCFFRQVIDGKLYEIDTDKKNTAKILSDLYDIVINREKTPVEGSYTNYLLDKGIDKILKKVGEESSEVIIAAKNFEKDEVIYETADLMYHLTVALAKEGVKWEDVFEELISRNK